MAYGTMAGYRDLPAAASRSAYTPAGSPVLGSLRDMSLRSAHTVPNTPYGSRPGSPLPTRRSVSPPTGSSWGEAGPMHAPGAGHHPTYRHRVHPYSPNRAAGPDPTRTRAARALQITPANEPSQPNLRRSHSFGQSIKADDSRSRNGARLTDILSGAPGPSGPSAGRMRPRLPGNGARSAPGSAPGSPRMGRLSSLPSVALLSTSPSPLSEYPSTNPSTPGLSYGVRSAATSSQSFFPPVSASSSPRNDPLPPPMLPPSLPASMPTSTSTSPAMGNKTKLPPLTAMTPIVRPSPPRQTSPPNQLPALRTIFHD